ncbi:unnamed protein product, partial [Pylaiella littoralis]
MAWATLMKLREALVKRAGEIYARRHPPAPGESSVDGKDLTSEQLESVAEEVFEELGNMDQTPVQHEMPAETTVIRTLALPQEVRVNCGKEKERFTLCLAVTADGQKVPVRIIFKGTPFIPTVTGVGRATQPRENSIAAEILPQNRRKFGHPMGGMSFGVQEESWCDLRECTLWIKESWRVRPNNGSVLKRRACILVLDDFQVPQGRRVHRLPQEGHQHHRHLHPRRVDSSPPTAGSHAQQADEAAAAGHVHEALGVGGQRPQDGQADTAWAWCRLDVVQGRAGNHHAGDGQDLFQDLRPLACARRQRRPR